MTQQGEFVELAINAVARSEKLQRAVRRALSLSAGLMAVSLMSASTASAASFPPVFPLARLWPAGGGDGSEGFMLTGIQERDFAGFAVSDAGDLNGDGLDDIVVGARGGGPSGQGASHVVFGSTQGFPAVIPLASLYPTGGGDGTRGFVLGGIDGTDYSGSAVSVAGDVNGDGISDLIIGARYADPEGLSTAGESYLVFGSTQPFPAAFPLTTSSSVPGTLGRTSRAPAMWSSAGHKASRPSFRSRACIRTAAATAV